MLNKQLEQDIVEYLRKRSFINKVYPWKETDNRPAMLALALKEGKETDSCLQELAEHFPDLRKTVTVERYQREPLTYFECKLSKADFIQLLRRNNILVFKSDEDFFKAKKEYERKLAHMNMIEFIMKEDTP